MTTERTDRHCPDCDLPLLRYALGELPIEQCRGCNGLFVERQDLERLRDDRASASRSRPAGLPVDSPSALATPAAREDTRYRRCPRCSRLMRHRLLGTGEGVMLDICARHGTWFDRTELQKAVWFACSGDVAEDRDLDEKELRSRLERLRGEREHERRDAGDDAASVAVWWGEELLSWLTEVRRRRATRPRRREDESDDGSG